MTRPSKAIIDLNAIVSNYKKLREMHGGCAFAVLKANAYGHGAIPVAKKLEGVADAFAVAFLKEGLELRSAGIKSPILILEGVFDVKELVQASSHGFWLAVHQEEQIAMIEQNAASLGGLNVWLKLDSGMNRLGLPVESVEFSYSRIAKLKCVSKVNLMTHFARADEPSVNLTKTQIEIFSLATENFDCEKSLCNSAGAMAWSGHKGTWSRLGIAMYGASPIEGDDFGLQPAMSLKSKVFAIKHVNPSDQVGYGGAFIADKEMRIGVVAIGYADGYPRHVSNGPVLVNGQLTRTVGRVSMDMMAVDLTSLPDAQIGSDVELWGAQLSVNNVAKQAGTISYEILCNTKRVDFEYI